MKQVTANLIAPVALLMLMATAAFMFSNSYLRSNREETEALEQRLAILTRTAALGQSTPSGVEAVDPTQAVLFGESNSPSVRARLQSRLRAIAELNLVTISRIEDAEAPPSEGPLELVAIKLDLNGSVEKVSTFYQALSSEVPWIFVVDAAVSSDGQEGVPASKDITLSSTVTVAVAVPRDGDATESKGLSP